MYGMINIAIQDLIVKDYGAATWALVKTKAGFKAESFVSMHAYPDALTYNLVGIASEITGIPPSKMLENIGEYWITHTAAQGYGPVLDLAGTNLVEFLKNQNTMHQGVVKTMPEMVIPIFEVSEERADSVILEYHSKRKGLEPMVVGLIKGLGKRCGFDCKVEMIETEKTEHTFQKYRVTW